MITVEIANRSGADVDESEAGELARRLLAAEGIDEAELGLAFVGSDEMRTLKRDHLGLDETTDVLSFPLEEPGILGDVVVSIDTARRQAKEGGWPLAAELRRLLAHGILHCRGYDHESAADARRMAAAERKLLGRTGMVGASLSGVE